MGSTGEGNGKPLQYSYLENPMLLLRRFSCVRLCVTPEMAAHQAPLSLGFSRQEHWSGLPFPSPMHESEVAQLRPTLSDPMDCSLPGSSIHGLFQARVLEWGAISFFPTQRISVNSTILSLVEWWIQYHGISPCIASDQETNFIAKTVFSYLVHTAPDTILSCKKIQL